jgi:hypothetical protein
MIAGRWSVSRSSSPLRGCGGCTLTPPARRGEDGSYEECPSCGRRNLARVDAQHASSSWAISSSGLRKPKRLRGRSLSSAATQSRSASLCTDRSLPFGKYWRSRPASDLLRRVLLPQILLDHATQRQVRGQLRRLRPRGTVVGQHVRDSRPIPAAVLAVAPQLSADRRRAAPEPLGNIAHGLARRPTQRDLLPLSEAQIPTLQIASPARAHPTIGDHPPRALLAIGPHRFGGIGDELTSLQRRPEHLHVLADHVIDEPGHQHPHSDRCCDHCKNPGIP